MSKLVTDEIVEAAAAAMAEGTNVQPRHYLKRAREALEVAAPMIAEALREQAVAAIEDNADQHDPTEPVYEAKMEAIDSIRELVFE